MSRSARTVIWSWLVWFVMCPAALAQTDSTAQITGVVKDPTGAVVRGVEVIATQTDTGRTHTATTNEAGFYALPYLSIGPYRVHTASPSFRSHVESGIVLQVNSNR